MIHALAAAACFAIALATLPPAAAAVGGVGLAVLAGVMSVMTGTSLRWCGLPILCLLLGWTLAALRGHVGVTTLLSIVMVHATIALLAALWLAALLRPISRFAGTSTSKDRSVSEGNSASASLLRSRLGRSIALAKHEPHHASPGVPGEGPALSLAWPGVAVLLICTLAAAWLTLPMWANGSWLAEIVSVHPVFAVDAAIGGEPAWSHRPIHYAMGVLGQDISYARPGSVWPCVLIHLLAALPAGGVMWLRSAPWR